MVEPGIYPRMSSSIPLIRLRVDTHSWPSCTHVEVVLDDASSCSLSKRMNDFILVVGCFGTSVPKLLISSVAPFHLGIHMHTSYRRCWNVALATKVSWLREILASLKGRSASLCICYVFRFEVILKIGFYRSNPAEVILIHTIVNKASSSYTHHMVDIKRLSENANSLRNMSL